VPFEILEGLFISLGKGRKHREGSMKRENSSGLGDTPLTASNHGVLRGGRFGSMVGHICKC